MFALSRNRMPLSSLSWRRHRTTCETAVDTGARSLVSRKLTRTVKEADMSYVHERAKKLGLPIIEATEPVFIGVAADDIRKAKMKNSKCCAFSRAAQKEPGVRAAYFFRSIAFIEYPDRIIRYALPASARTELLSFDRSGVMAPGEYRLAPPPKSPTIANVRAYTEKKRKKQRVKITAKPSRRVPGGAPILQHVGTVRATEAPRTRSHPKYVRTTAEP